MDSIFSGLESARQHLTDAKSKLTKSLHSQINDGHLSETSNEGFDPTSVYIVDGMPSIEDTITQADGNPQLGTTSPHVQTFSHGSDPIDVGRYDMSNNITGATYGDATPIENATSGNLFIESFGDTDAELVTSEMQGNLVMDLMIITVNKGVRLALFQITRLVALTVLQPVTQTQEVVQMLGSIIKP